MDIKNIDSKDEEYIKSKIVMANDLIQALEKRRNTLLNLLRCIVKIQEEFFKKGDLYLKPMTLKSIAVEMNIHESTVSRAIREKYILTERGIVKVKDLFSKKLLSKSSSNKEISINKIKSRIKEIIGENEFNDLMLHTALSVPDEIKPKIIDIYEQMLIEYDNYDSVAEFALQNLLEQLILIMYRYGTVAETSEIHISTADTAIMDILSYIDTNFMNNPSVSELAKKAGLSESHFMKRFRDATGCSYKTYVNRYKNKIAQTMLAESPKSIQEISNELGFCSSNYFCTLFKQINGMSPLQYRKKAVK